MFFVVPIPRIRSRSQAPRPLPPPPAHFALTPTTPDGETALFQDHRVGFSHALPGWPQASHVTATAGPGEPPADALVQLWDFPMWLRYKVDRLHGPAPSAMHVAIDYASRYVAARTREQVALQPARADRIAAWSVDAGAGASYALAQPDPLGATHEDLTVLVRHGVVLAVTRRYANAAQDWLRHSTFRAIADATMIWDPQRYRYDAKVWPPSTYLQPTLVPMLLPNRQAAVPGIAAGLRLPQTEAQALGAVLEAMMRSDAAPWTPLTPEIKAGWMRELANAVTMPHAMQLLSQGLNEAQTAHDLRGFALLTGTALAQTAV
jgi:hypothetical protein